MDSNHLAAQEELRCMACSRCGCHLANAMVGSLQSDLFFTCPLMQ
jgi:hypothetical protein